MAGWTARTGLVYFPRLANKATPILLQTPNAKPNYPYPKT